MKPWKVIATEGKWTLRQRGDEFMVQSEGRILHSSKRHGSEDQHARIGCARLVNEGPKVLLGGLGFGFTLRAVLDVLPVGARVTVAEPSQAVVDWSRGAVAQLADSPLDDPRVNVVVGEVLRVLPKHRGAFDVILLDYDMAPVMASSMAYSNLYDLGGLSSLRASLKKGSGRVAVFSAGPQPGVTKRMKEVGFTPNVQKTNDGKYLVFVGDA
jgi:predicted membrane-bound spermidine synthase